MLTWPQVMKSAASCSSVTYHKLPNTKTDQPSPHEQITRDVLHISNNSSIGWIFSKRVKTAFRYFQHLGAHKFNFMILLLNKVAAYESASPRELEQSSSNQTLRLCNIRLSNSVQRGNSTSIDKILFSVQELHSFPYPASKIHRQTWLFLTWPTLFLSQSSMRGSKMRSVCNCEFVTSRIASGHFVPPTLQSQPSWVTQWVIKSYPIRSNSQLIGNNTALRLWRRSHTCWSMSDTYTVLRMLSSRCARLVRLLTRLLLVPLYPFFCYHMADTMDQHTSLKITHCRHQKRTSKRSLIAPPPCFWGHQIWAITIGAPKVAAPTVTQVHSLINKM